jgi:DNA-binding transcriptional MerR regulator
VRIGDLSKLTGVPVATIKYYQREGLLPYGERTERNQAKYADEHVHRLRLVRALVDIAHLPIATAREVLTAVETPGRDLFKVLGAVHYAVTALPDDAEPDQQPVDELVERLGWRVKEANPSRRALANILGVLAELGHTDVLDRVDDYAEHAARLAAIDVGILDGGRSRDEILESAVVVTLFGDTLVSLLRRMAQEDLSTKYRPDSVP